MAFVWARRVCLTLGCLLIMAGTGYGGLIGFMSWREGVSPSTSRVLVLKDGRQIPLAQPTRPMQPSQPTPDTTANAPGAPTKVIPDATYPLTYIEATPVRSHEVLPPLRVKIAGIGVDWPVVLADNDAMPRFKGVGWLIGSTYPGEAGNLVLFGHLDGPYSTFGRLSELQPGDTFSVLTETGEYHYRMRESFETTPDDVSVLAPTDTATATLITCSGHWDPIAQNYSHRLIVKAEYLAP